MKRLDLEVPGRPASSSVLIGRDLLATPAPEVLAEIEGRLVFVLTSRPLAELLRERLRPLLAPAGRVVDLSPVPDGEDAKSIEVAAGLWQEMLAAGCLRDSLLVTLGGGSVGDLGGFVAGCCLRGIDYLQVPTTMLAQVDASVGGKTAVNIEAGKNLVGCFHHPRFVLADTSTLGTLSARELRSGLVEAVKMAALLDAAMFERAERQLDRWLAADPAALTEVVEGSVRAKQRVVAEDPEERTGGRRALNFGHTLGHAIEKQWGFGNVCHGEAVAYGMLFALRLSQRLGLLEGDLGERLRALLGRLRLPPLPPGLEAEALQALMARDKKATARGLVWVLPRRLGEMPVMPVVDPELVHGELGGFLSDPWQ